MSAYHLKESDPLDQASGLGLVPSHWTGSRLKFIMSRIVAGGTPDVGDVRFWADSDDEGGIPWVTIQDMSRRFGIRETDRKLTIAGLRAARLKVVPAGTLVYSMYASVGKVGRLEIPAAVNQAILGLVPDHARVHVPFLHWWLEHARQYVTGFSSSSTQDNLSADKVGNLRLPIARMDEQRTIASFLDRKTAEIDALVAKKERLIELLEEKRTALITQAVTKGLDPNVPMKESGVPWLGLVPVGWDVKPVGSLADPLVGFAFPSDRFSMDDGIPLLRGDNVTSGSVRWGDKTRRWPFAPPSLRYLLSPGDIVIGMDGSKVGRNYAVIAEKDVPVLLVQRVTRLRTTPQVNPWFLFHAIANPRFHGHVDFRKTDPAIPHITLKDIESFKVGVPRPSEQQEIVRTVTADLSAILELQQACVMAVGLLEEYRSALITAAVTGQMLIPEPPAEAA